MNIYPSVVYPVMLVGAFVPLLLGAELVVRAASLLATRLRVAPILVGLTIIAFGTSLPELVINVTASLRGTSAITLGNVIGSNTFNIGATIGILALIKPLTISRPTTWVEIPFAILAAVALFGITGTRISRTEGVALLLGFLAFMGYIGVMVRRSGEPLPAAAAEIEDLRARIPALKHPVYAPAALVPGLLLLALGGEGIVRGGIETARLLGIPEYTIAASVIAVGSSLPELATGLTAVRHGEIDLAVGNAVGSNIFNVFLVVGVSATIRPIEAIPRPLDHGAHVLTAVLLFIFVFTGGGRRIDRWEGAILLLAYAIYAGSLFLL